MNWFNQYTVLATNWFYLSARLLNNSPYLDPQETISFVFWAWMISLNKWGRSQFKSSLSRQSAGFSARWTIDMLIISCRAIFVINQYYFRCVINLSLARHDPFSRPESFNKTFQPLYMVASKTYRWRMCVFKNDCFLYCSLLSSALLVRRGNDGM